LAPRHVYLVRHGETDGESSIRFHGRNDVALSELGHEQVRRLVPLLSEVAFAAVVHSPLQRAATSARLLLEGLRHRPPVVEPDPDLVEIHFGDFEGWTEREIAARVPEWHAAWRAGKTEGFPNGDNHEAFAARVAAAWDRLLARHPAGDLLVVSHHGVIRRALAHCLGLDREATRRLHVSLASVTIVRIGERAELVELGRLPG
jgi:broad specificity phosphatase PhoE